MLIFLLCSVIYLAGSIAVYRRLLYLCYSDKPECIATTCCSGCRCKNCGGSPQYHRGGRYYGLHTNSGKWTGCDNYVQSHGHLDLPGVAISIPGSLMLWWLIVPIFYIYKFSKEHDLKFAKAPPSIETKSEKIARLEQERTDYIEETNKMLLDAGYTKDQLVKF